MTPSPDGGGEGLYHFGHHRDPAQLARMRALADAGQCLFCPPLVDDPADPDVVAALDGWVLRTNTYPYPGTARHLLLVPRDHVRDLLELSAADREGFWAALALAKAEFGLAYYALAARCGDCVRTGGTIEHLHVHLIVGDVDDPDHEPVRVKVSSRPPR